MKMTSLRIMAFSFSLIALFSASSFGVNYQPETSSDNWPVDELNVAAQLRYLNQEERRVILELNKARTNPSRYADLYIKPLLNKFEGHIYLQGNVRVDTSEGKSAVSECIASMSTAKPADILQPDKSLSELANHHVIAQGITGETGHILPSGENVLSSISELNLRYRQIAQDISYGDSDARDIVIALLVDDGAPFRGHRQNILDPNFSRVGVKIGPHRIYQHMCVIDFAGN